MKRITVNVLAITICLLSFPARSLADDAMATLAGHSDSVWSVDFSPDGRLLASGSADSTVKLWDTESREAVAVLAGHSDSVRSVCFSPDGNLLASGSFDSTVKLWDVTVSALADPRVPGESCKEIATLKGHSDSVHSVSFSPDGNLLASGSSDRTVRLWDVAGHREIATLKGHSDSVYSVSFSSDGSLLASGSADATVKVWDVETGREVTTLVGHLDSVYSVSFSPDDGLLASGGGDKAVRLWDVVSSTEVAELMGHSRSVRSVSFSPDGEPLASGGWDNIANLWDVETGEEMVALREHSGPVLAVSFSSDGRVLATGSADFTVKLWNVSTFKKLPPIADFTANRTSGVPPMTVWFTDLSENRPASWLWDFGDGTTSTFQNPTHTYSEFGDYTVKLTVQNSAGSDRETKKDYIHVVDAVVPMADFSASPVSGIAPLSVAFSDLSENEPTSWLWDFGDGETSDAQNPRHVYSQPGYYTVRLTAENPAGSDVRTKRDYIHAVEAKITLHSGILNDVTVDPYNPVIEVLESARISGTLSIAVHRAYEADAVFSVGAAPTWGDRETNYWTVAEQAKPGITRHTATVRLKAPASEGTYYIVVAGAPETGVGQIMSCTHRKCDGEVWYDGNDAVDWDPGTMQHAVVHGYVTVPWLMEDGQYADLETGATAVRVVVTKMQSISCPCDAAADSSGNVYLADTGNNRILKFAPDGALVRMWGMKGSGYGQFDWPQSIAVDTSGSVYVADRNNHRIQRFTSEGAFMTAWGMKGNRSGQFNYPNGIAVDVEGNIYVVDTLNYRIQKFTSSGGFLKEWGTRGSGQGQFDRAQGIAADENVYVTDRMSNRVQEFTSEGNFLMAWGTRGHGCGQFNEPHDIATDGSGNIYVADTMNHRIQRFTSEGLFLNTIGEWGYGNEGLNMPQGVAADELGHIYVADTGNNRIQAFMLTHIITTKAGANGSISPSGEIVVPHRADQTFAVIPDEGYHISVLLVDGKPVIGRPKDSYTFENVTSNHTIEAIFMVDSYTVTATAGDHGSISPWGEVTVKHGGVQTFTITPVEGYHVADVLVDGSSVGAVATYTFLSVTADHTIEAAFAADIYTITPTAGANGSISPSEPVTLNRGASQTFAITPAEGYDVADVLVDGESVGPVTTYTFDNVAADHTIEAVFLDTEPPIGSIIVANGAQYGNTQSVTLRLSASDNSGAVSQMRFSNDNVTYSDWEAYTSVREWSLSPGDGLKTVYVQYVDETGNQSIDEISDSIILDATSPTGSVVVNDGDKYCGSTKASLTLSATDSGSGVAEMIFSNDNVTFSSPETYSTAKTWNLTIGDGTKTVYARFKDAAGNWSTDTVSDSIVVDATSPEVVSTSPESGDRNIPINALIKIDFSEDMVESSISISVSGSISGHIKGEVSYSNRSLAFAAGRFSDKEKITVEVTGLDLAANRLAYSMEFSTGIGVWPGDTNRDGTVDISDVFPIGRYWHKKGHPRTPADTSWKAQPAVPWEEEEATHADADGNGVVEEADLNVINQNWGARVAECEEKEGSRVAECEENERTRATAAPALIDTKAEPPGIEQLRACISMLVPSLEESLPACSSLGQNYPNPFNPDTWIPYQLAGRSDVTIEIYSTVGHLVRTLSLGHRDAGTYTTKQRAAHWDGRNNFGELVSSGIYFYSIKAGRFTDTKKLVVAF